MKTEELIKQLSDEQTPATLTSPMAQTARKPLFRTLLWWALHLAILILCVALMGYRHDLDLQLQSPAFLAETLLCFAIMATASAASSWLALPDAGGKAWLRWLPIPFAAGLALLLIARTIMIWSHGGNFDGSSHMDCTIEIIEIALLPSLITFFMMRKAAPTRLYWAGGLASLSGLALGYLVLRLVEPTDDLLHILLWHLLPMLFCAALGAIIGRYTLRW